MACEGCDEENPCRDASEALKERFTQQEATIYSMRQQIASLETRIENLLGAHFLVVKEAMSR